MPRARLLPAVLAAIAISVGAAAPAVAAPAQAPDGAWFRMAHFATDVPPVDLYLVPKSGEQTLVLKGLAYGGVSPYMRVAPGSYTANVRVAGEDPASAPAITGTAEIVAGSAYTFAAFGTAANVTQRLLTDDLTPPAAGQARVRLIQAAGVPVETDLLGAAEPATITAYRSVPAGQPVVRITAEGAPPVTEPVSLDDGSVHSLIVLRRGADLVVSDVEDTFTDDGPARGGNAEGGTVVRSGTQAGDDELPRTGAELGVLAAAAVVMIVLGRQMLVASRR